MTGMPSRDCSTATCWIAFVILGQSFGVLAAGEAPPPERIDPTAASISTFSIISGFSGPRSQSLAGSPWSLRTSTWVICPAFSASVMRPSRSDTRCATESFGFLYGSSGAWLMEARAPAGDPDAVAAAPTSIIATVADTTATPRDWRAAERDPGRLRVPGLVTSFISLLRTLNERRQGFVHRTSNRRGEPGSFDRRPMALAAD